MMAHRMPSARSEARYEKIRVPSGRSFADTPENVTNARNISLNPSGVD